MPTQLFTQNKMNQLATTTQLHLLQKSDFLQQFKIQIIVSTVSYLM